MGGCPIGVIYFDGGKDLKNVHGLGEGGGGCPYPLSQPTRENPDPCIVVIKYNEREAQEVLVVLKIYPQ